MVFLKHHAIFREDMTVVLPFFSRYSSSCYPGLELGGAFKDKMQWGDKTVNGNNVWIKPQGMV